MKILITGSDGQLGGALQATVPAGNDITAIDIADCDITDENSVAALIKNKAPDVVINAAAYTAVDKAESNEGAAHAVNASAVQYIVGALAREGGRLVQVSTDFVFDGDAASAYRPGDRRAPLSVYGRTKAEGEDALRPNDLLVRTSWVYEAGGANFVRTMLRLMKDRDELGIVADQIGCPTWATSLANVLWGLIAKEKSGAYHYSDAGVASWYDFAVAIAEEALALGMLETIPDIRPIGSGQYPTPARRPKFSLLDCSETHAALGTAPTHWRKNLRLMLQQEKALG